jgi:flagellar basal-body rod modification protein FlgD
LIQTNQTLSTLLSLSESGKVSNAVNFLGAKVVAEGSATLFDGTAADWNITTTTPATRAIVQVKDATGNVVSSSEISLNGTTNKYTWDGKTSAGTKAAAGVYSLSVEAFNSSGTKVNSSTDIMGTVDGIDLTGDEPVLKIGTLLVPMSLIKTVTRTATAA